MSEKRDVVAELREVNRNLKAAVAPAPVAQPVPVPLGPAPGQAGRF